MKHAQRTEKYKRLIFNSYISDDDFFKSPYALHTRTIFFLEIFKAKRGCALCTNAHYETLNTVMLEMIKFIKHQEIFYTHILTKVYLKTEAKMELSTVTHFKVIRLCFIYTVQQTHFIFRERELFPGFKKHLKRLQNNCMMNVNCVFSNQESSKTYNSVNTNISGDQKSNPCVIF